MSRSAPTWPRTMRRDLAALYCDMTVAEFERGIARGILPPPVKVVDQDRWSTGALDAALDRLFGDRKPDWRKGSKLYDAA